MIITKLNQNSSFTKATISKNLKIVKENNHQLTIQNFIISQTLPSPILEIVTIQKDKPLIAIVFRNNNI